MPRFAAALRRELACHALEQYTTRPWRHSPLQTQAKDGSGMVRGAVPTVAELRRSCDAEVGYLRAQCYRAVLELELRTRGVPARTAVGSVKHMERLGFGAYAAKALARLERSGVLPPPDSGSAATLEAGLPWEGGPSGAAKGAAGLAQPGPQQEQHQAKEEEEERQHTAKAGEGKGKGKGKGKGQAPAVPHELSRSYEPELGEWKRFIAFYALRLCLAPLLESVILIDRLQFLQEAAKLCSDSEQETALLPIFEPALSPRNFVLVARRRPKQRSVN